MWAHRGWAIARNREATPFVSCLPHCKTTVDDVADPSLRWIVRRSVVHHSWENETLGASDGYGVARPVRRRPRRAPSRRSVTFPSMVSVRSVIERYLVDLQATLATNMDEARRMLRLALARIVWRRDGRHLVAEVTGNCAGLLNLDGCVSSAGAGRGILRLPPWPKATRIVAPLG
jgi:hypothetical protein